MRLIDLQQRKIVIVGVGVNNRNMADYFSSHNVPYDVIENWKTPEELSLKLKGYDVIFRTPGLPYLSKPIQEAKDSGAIIYSQTKLFFDVCPAGIIGVTGTKGKGTTSSLIYSIIKKDNRKVYLGGNFGRDPFDFLDQLKDTDLVVMELSSFQLQDLEKSPQVAVVLSISPDHLDHHKNMEEYITAKSNILKYQNDNDLAIIHQSLPENFKKLGKARKIVIDPRLVKDWPRKLLGEHNLNNISAAVLVAKSLNIAESTIKTAVMEFQPLAHRLNIIRKVEEVSYVDDSYSTNTDPVIAAINSFDTPEILIIGGYDKGIDFSPIGKQIISSKQIKAVVVIGQMTEKILKVLQGYQGKILTGAKNMQEIVAQARSVAKAGDTVILSPGTSSFDMFKNATDRAEQFIAEINKL